MIYRNSIFESGFLHLMRGTMRKALALSLLIPGLFIAMQAQAGINEWTTTGPAGSTINSLAIDPVNPTIIYAGAGESGGLSKSTDSGVTWIAVNNGLIHARVLALAIDPVTPTTIYAGRSAADGTGGVFKSTDGGATWAAMSTGLTDLHINSLAIDPALTSTLYAGTGAGVFKSLDSGATWAATGQASSGVFAFIPVSGTLYVGTPVGVFWSGDGGVSWLTLNNGLTNTFVTSLVVDQLAPLNIYAGTNGGGIFKSIDGGLNWALSSAGLTGGALQINAMTIDPVTPTTLYAGTGAGVFKSTDSGVNWVASNTGLPSTGVGHLIIDPLSPANLYATTDFGRDGISKSINSGATWTANNTGLAGSLVLSLAIDPVTFTTIYAGTARAGFKSTDGGATWTLMAGGLPTVSLNLQAFAIDPQNPLNVYAGTLGGFYRSTDAGTTWTASNAGLTALDVRSLAMDQFLPSSIYAGKGNNFNLPPFPATFHNSFDSGSTWVPSSALLPAGNNIHALAIPPFNSNIIYAGTEGSGVFKRTINNAGQWVWAPTSLTGVFVSSLAITRTAVPTIYAGTNSGIFKSSDGGATWTAINTGLPVGPVKSLAIDPLNPSTIYAGFGLFIVNGHGVFKSTDSGVTWTAMNTGLTNLVVRALAIDPLAPATIYAGTLGGGVFEYTDTPSDLEVTKTAAPNPVQVGNNLTYTITVTNNGPLDPATGVTLTDALPAGVTFVSATPSQGAPCIQTGVTVTCNLGDLTMVAPATVSIVVTPTQPGQITNTVTVAGNENDPTPGNNTAQAVTTVNAVPPPPAPPPAAVCTNLLALNTPFFNTGSTLTLGAQLVPWAGASTADAYVSVRTPAGTAIYLQMHGTFAVAPTPMVSNWTVAPFNGQIFSHTFGGGEPAGLYVVNGFFTVPGTFNATGPQFCPKTFTFIP